MKFKIFMAGCIIFTGLNPGDAFAVAATKACLGDATCQTAYKCITANTGSGYKYCCPTCYATVNKTTCPTGYSPTTTTNQLGTTTVCARSATDAGSDETGYLVQNYGTCTPTTSSYQQDCYTPTLNEIFDTNGMTACVQIGNPGVSL